MSFTLNLGIGGLCLIAHETDTGGALTKVHVLLPTASGHEAHLPRLVFDPAALFGDAPTGTQPEHFLLDNRRIDLSGLSSTTPLSLPPGVADLNAAYGCTVPRALVADDYAGGAITTRITFTAGRGRVAPCGAGAFWMLGGTEQQLLIRAVWSIDVDADDLQVSVLGINGSTDQDTLTFRPYAGSLDLWIFHSPLDQLPDALPPKTRHSTPDRDAPADHFSAFLDLLECTGDPPTFIRPEYDASVKVYPSCYDDTGRGLEATCCAAGGPVYP